MPTLLAVLTDLGLYILMLCLFVFMWAIVYHLLMLVLPLVDMPTDLIQEAALIICLAVAYFFFNLYIKSIEE